MNILPNKSWHVWNRKNRDRVERDEEEHKQKLEEEHRERIAAARKERYNLLRQKAGVEADAAGPAAGREAEDETEAPKEHVNLFMDEERTASMRKGHEARGKRKAKETRKKSNVPEGAMELGQSSAERMKDRPWYWGAQGRAQEEGPVSRRQETRKRKRLEEDDPLAQMKKYVKQKKSHERERRRELSSFAEAPPRRRGRHS